MNYLDTITQRAQPKPPVIQPTGGQRSRVGNILVNLLGGKTDTAKQSEYLTGSNTVYACVSGRADLLKSLPLKAYRLDKTRARRFVNKQQRRVYTKVVMQNLRSVSPLYHTRQLNAAGYEEVTGGYLVELLQSVNPFWTRDRLMELTETGLGLWGKSFWFLEKKGTRPVEIWTAPGDKVDVIPGNLRAGKFVSRYEYTPAGEIEPIKYQPDEVIWFNYADPRDLWGSLSPLLSAGIYASYEQDSMAANQKLHLQGYMPGGIIWPKGEGEVWEESDAGAIEAAINKRIRGVDKAHRWAVFRQQVEMKSFGMTPKDAEFINGLNISARAIARAYKWPAFLLGIADATYENLKEAKSAAWTQAILPEAMFMASELTEQLVPMFGNEADLVLFDASGVPELQEAEAMKWERASGQIEKGTLKINEWRAMQGLEDVPWGFDWWIPGTNVPAGSRPVEPRGIDEPRTADDFEKLVRRVMEDVG